jgi:hypothetical protein
MEIGGVVYSPYAHVMLLGRCKMPDAKVKLLIVDDERA